MPTCDKSSDVAEAERSIVENSSPVDGTNKAIGSINFRTHWACTSGFGLKKEQTIKRERKKKQKT